MTDLAKQRLDAIQVAIHDQTKDLDRNNFIDVTEALASYVRTLAAAAEAEPENDD